MIAKIKAIGKWLQVNFTYHVEKAWGWFSAVMAVIGFLGTFTSVAVVPENWGLAKKITVSLLILILFYLVCFLFFCIYSYLKKEYLVYEINKHKVYVLYGDVFSGQFIRGENKKRTIVIPVNRCFDTIIDDDLISRERLHGIAMERLYHTLDQDGQPLFTTDSLNQHMQKQLQDKHIAATRITTLNAIKKRKGNLKRWPVGTITEVKESDDLQYFFLGLTTFDSQLHANITEKEYVLALTEMLLYCNQRAQGYPVVLPLIGTGAANAEKNERIALEYIVHLLKLHRNLIGNDFYIVVHDREKDHIPITNL